MADGKIMIYTGDGHGKTPAAMGVALQTASRGGNVTVVQFLKGRGLEDTELIKRLEPEIRIFRFEKSDIPFDQRTQEEKDEDLTNIRNGLNFARKVLSTAECDLLILDEVLGLVDNKIITVSELRSLLENRKETDVILTGITMNDEICMFASEITKFETVKFKTFP